MGWREGIGGILLVISVGTSKYSTWICDYRYLLFKHFGAVQWPSLYSCVFVDLFPSTRPQLGARSLRTDHRVSAMRSRIEVSRTPRYRSVGGVQREDRTEISYFELRMYTIHA